MSRIVYTNRKLAELIVELSQADRPPSAQPLTVAEGLKQNASGFPEASCRRPGRVPAWSSAGPELQQTGADRALLVTRVTAS